MFSHAPHHQDDAGQKLVEANHRIQINHPLVFAGCDPAPLLQHLRDLVDDFALSCGSAQRGDQLTAALLDDLPFVVAVQALLQFIGQSLDHFPRLDVDAVELCQLFLGQCCHQTEFGPQ